MLDSISAFGGAANIFSDWSCENNREEHRQSQWHPAGYGLQFELFLNHLSLVTDGDCRIMNYIYFVNHSLITET